MKPIYNFEEKKFNIKTENLKGFSAKSIEEHLKLYSGYVKNANIAKQKINELKADFEKNAYAISEIGRRFSFEWNGIKNHEVYFESLQEGSVPSDKNSNLYKEIEKNWGDFNEWLTEFKALAMTRGIGWAMLYKDNATGVLVNSWVDEQHLGQLQDCTLILGLDMWEHSYVADYAPSGKKQYVEDFFSNLNWKIVEGRF